MFELFHALPKVSISLGIPNSPCEVGHVGILTPPLEIKKMKPNENKELANQGRQV